METSSEENETKISKDANQGQSNNKNTNKKLKRKDILKMRITEMEELGLIQQTSEEQKEELAFKMAEQERLPKVQILTFEQKETMKMINKQYRKPQIAQGTTKTPETPTEKKKRKREAKRLKKLRNKRMNVVRQKNLKEMQEMEALEQQLLMMSDAEEKSIKTKDQMQSSFPPDSEEIKIENETLQETTIQTIPANHSENSISNIKPESISETSWSCIRPGGETFMNSVTSTSNTFFQSLNEGSCSVSDNFEDNSNSSTKIDRRKTNVEESLSCLKELIEATAKPDSLTLFGKYIAHKLRASKKDVAEINIAKLNIEKVLENLAVGAYNSEIVKQEI